MPDNTSLDTPVQSDSQNQKNPITLLEGCEFFHNEEDVAYMSIPLDGHTENLEVGTEAFEDFLTHEHLIKTGEAPSEHVIKKFTRTARAKARFEGTEYPVGLRVLEHSDSVYIDLGDRDWTAVQIRKGEVCLIKNPPVKFVRSRGMKPLPPFIQAGSISFESLFSFINADSSTQRQITGWIIGALRAKGPFPPLIITGPPGSGKSFLMRVLRTITDPHACVHQELPKTERDLLILARNNRALTFDNFSGSLGGWLSDALCKLSTGTSLTHRVLHTNDSQLTFNGCRPMILNSVDDGIIANTDLAQRAIIVHLHKIPTDKRKTEQQMWSNFEDKLPMILYSLYKNLSMALKEIEESKSDWQPTDLSRMADFHLLTSKLCSIQNWDKEDFFNNSKSARSVADIMIAENSVITQVIKAESWILPLEGEPTFVYENLSRTKAAIVHQKRWPSTCRIFSQQLNRIEPGLAELGIKIERNKRGTRRFWKIDFDREKLKDLNSGFDEYREYEEEEDDDDPADG